MMKWFLHIIQANRNNNQSLLQDWHRQHIGPEKQQPTMSTATENWPIHPWSKNRKASGCQKMILQEWLRNMETYMHTTQHGMSDISWWTYETNYKTFWVSETDHWDAVQECWRQLENLHASNSQSFHTPISMECWISTKGPMKQITKPFGCQRQIVGVQWKMKSLGHLQHETAFRVQSKLVWVAVVATYETARCGVSETDLLRCGVRMLEKTWKLTWSFPTASLTHEKHWILMGKLKQQPTTATVQREREREREGGREGEREREIPKDSERVSESNALHWLTHEKTGLAWLVKFKHQSILAVIWLQIVASKKWMGVRVWERVSNATQQSSPTAQLTHEKNGVCKECESFFMTRSLSKFQRKLARMTSRIWQRWGIFWNKKVGESCFEALVSITRSFKVQTATAFLNVHPRNGPVLGGNMWFPFRSKTQCLKPDSFNSSQTSAMRRR